MKEQIIEILQSITAIDDIADETALIDDEILNSLALFELIAELENTFHISIVMENITSENFNSCDNICALVEQLGGK